MNGKSRLFKRLLEYCQTVPIIDTHDHTSCLGPKYTDPIQVVVYGYMISDLACATSENEAQLLLDVSIPWEQRWPILEKAWKKASNTGYAWVTSKLLKKFYQVDEITFESMQKIQANLMDLENENLFEKVLTDAHIVLRLQNILDLHLGSVINKTLSLTPRSRLVIPLPDFHLLQSSEQIKKITESVDKVAGSLDEYVSICGMIFHKFKEYGAAAFKDQSAYSRKIDFEDIPQEQADTIFQSILMRKDGPIPTENMIALSNFLFIKFMKFAEELNLPVQIHTGLLDRMYGDIRGTNASNLIPMIDSHRNVKFDLLHANWPYGGDILFLAKNFPNVSINFCWTQMIDPHYAQQLMKQAICSIPLSKVHAFGSDHGGHAILPPGGRPDRAWAAAEIARENVSWSLTDLLEKQYVSFNQAINIMDAWFFHNPNDFYNLQLKFDRFIK